MLKPGLESSVIPPKVILFRLKPSVRCLSSGEPKSEYDVIIVGGGKLLSITLNSIYTSEILNTHAHLTPF